MWHKNINMIKKKIRIFEGFAGYGGGSFGLKRLKENMPDVEFEVVAYSEFDKYASALFDANHKDKDGNPLKNWGDITKIDPYDPEYPDIDMFMGGFPRQPYSSAGMHVVQCSVISYESVRLKSLNTFSLKM